MRQNLILKSFINSPNRSSGIQVRYRDFRPFLSKIFPVLLWSLAFSYPSRLVMGQAVPSKVENIPYLMTFGNKAETSWGDDDYSQTFFFLVPEDYSKSIYIRVFDPDCGGVVDEINGAWDTQTSFSVYGGKGCWSNPDAQNDVPAGNYRSGNLMASKTFAVNPQYDNNWYAFGPFNASEGESHPQFPKMRIFKVISEGIAGNDGNMYQYFMSTEATSNKAIEGANAFAYEYSFRMWDDPKQVSHVYPYVDDRTITVKVSNFDWDSDGHIKIISVKRVSQKLNVSGEDIWIDTEFKVEKEEINTSLDVQLIKRPSPAIRNNNVVISIKNQYNEFQKFYAAPIGGIPKPKISIGADEDE